MIPRFLGAYLVTHDRSQSLKGNGLANSPNGRCYIRNGPFQLPIYDYDRTCNYLISLHMYHNNILLSPGGRDKTQALYNAVTLFNIDRRGGCPSE